MLSLASFEQIIHGLHYNTFHLAFWKSVDFQTRKVFPGRLQHTPGAHPQAIKLANYERIPFIVCC